MYAPELRDIISDSLNPLGEKKVNWPCVDSRGGDGATTEIILFISTLMKTLIHITLNQNDTHTNNNQHVSLRWASMPTSDVGLRVWSSLCRKEETYLSYQPGQASTMAQGRDSGWRAFCQKGLGSEGSWPEDNTTLARSTHHSASLYLLCTA